MSDIEGPTPSGEQDVPEQPTLSGRSPSRSYGHNPDTEKSHQLKTMERGKSEIERMATQIETRRQERILVTMPVRKRFLKHFLQLGKKNNYPPGRIVASHVRDFRDVVQQEVEANEQRSGMVKGLGALTLSLGFRDNKETLLRVLNRALEVIAERGIQDDEFFFYQDFNFYFTKQESRSPWRRSQLAYSLGVIVIFYVATAVLFCSIMKSDGICPDDPENPGLSYYGGLSAVYFASVTMSTVGYGDLSIYGGSDDPTDGQVFVAILYMIAAMFVASTALSFGVDTAASANFVTKTQDYLFNKLVGEYKEGMLLYKHIRRVKIVKYTYIFSQFMCLNLLGLFVSRGFVLDNAEPSENWNWMKSFYWSVQATTTIGYGDISMPFGFRWFQIFYLVIATYFVGNALGRVGNLRDEILDIRREHAWKRREISKGMIEEMQATDNDGRVDQYEFAVASLLTLGKIDAGDIYPIMDKFRNLAGKKGYISIEEQLGDVESGAAASATERFEEERMEDALESGANFFEQLKNNGELEELCGDLHD